MNPLRILFLTDNFPPEVNAPASRTFEHCRAWVRAGHEVTVVTCAPNFPAGRVYPGYRNRLWSRESMDGIEVVRVWSFIAANAGFLKRTADYVSYAASAVVAGLRLRRADVVVATSPQFFAAVAGWLVGALRRTPFVFELRDLWPESIRAVGALKSKPVLEALERLELFLYRRAAAVVSVTRSFREDLVRRGIDRRKIAVITNGADLGRFHPRPRDPELAQALGLEGRFVAGYVGTHGLAHGLETVIEAAARVAASPGGEGIRFLFLGDGAAKSALVESARAKGLVNLVFVDSQPKSEVARYWSLLDVSIIHLRDDPLFATVIPSKLFECMAMGLPVLHAVPGESADLVCRSGVGRTLPPGDPQALAEALLALADDRTALAAMAARGPAAARAFDRDVLADRMLTILKAVGRGEGLPDPARVDDDLVLQLVPVHVQERRVVDQQKQDVGAF